MINKMYSLTRIHSCVVCFFAEVNKLARPLTPSVVSVIVVPLAWQILSAHVEPSLRPFGAGQVVYSGLLELFH